MSDGENIERAALESLHAAADEQSREALGLETAMIGGAFVSIASELPASAIVVNRAIGIGLHEPADRLSASKTVCAFKKRGVARYFLHLHPEAGPADIAGWLKEDGLEQTRGWMKFDRGTEPPPEISTELRVSKIGPAHGPAFGAIVSDAFDLGPKAAGWLANLPAQSGWHIYMTFAGNEPAGTGALFVKDGIGWCDWGATAPQFRGRGGQSALLAARVRDAIAFGCRAIHTCTGEEVPGDPQHSYSNILKMGFRENYIRTNFAPPKPGG